MAAQPGPDRPGRIRLIGQHPRRAQPWPPPAAAGHADRVHDRGELRRIPPLSRRHDDRQRLLALLTRQMDLGGEPAPRAAQPMIGRLSAHPTRRLALRSTILAGTSSVLMSPAHRRVHAHLPADPAHGIGRCLGAGDHLHPSAIPLPAPEQPVNGLPRPITGRHIPPRRPRPHPPADPVNQLPGAAEPAGHAPTGAAAPAPEQPTAHRSDHPGPLQDHLSAAAPRDQLLKQSLAARPGRDRRAGPIFRRAPVSASVAARRGPVLRQAAVWVVLPL